MHRYARECLRLRPHGASSSLCGAVAMDTDTAIMAHTASRLRYGYGHNGPHSEPAAPCRGGCGSTRPRDCDASRAISTSPRPRGLLHFSHPCSRCADDGNTRVCGEPAHCAWRVRTQLGLSAPSHTTIGRWCGGAGQSGRILISRHLVQHHTGGG